MRVPIKTLSLLTLLAVLTGCGTMQTLEPEKGKVAISFNIKKVTVSLFHVFTVGLPITFASFTANQTRMAIVHRCIFHFGLLTLCFVLSLIPWLYLTLSHARSRRAR